MRVASWHRGTPMSALYRASGGNGSERARADLNIGVPGKYEVFEWHAYLGSSSGAVREGTNVPHKIRHAKGEIVVRVDQSRNSGRWNSLGVYDFSTNSGQFVEISNDADGPVVADAIKLVYRGSDGNLDVTSPNPPTGLTIQN